MHNDESKNKKVEKLIDLLQKMGEAQSEVSKAIAWYVGSLSSESIMNPLKRAIHQGRENSQLYAQDDYWISAILDSLHPDYSYVDAIEDVEKQISLLKEEVKDYAFKAVKEANHALFEDADRVPSSDKVREAKINYYLNVIDSKLELIRELKDELSRIREGALEISKHSPWLEGFLSDSKRRVGSV